MCPDVSDEPLRIAFMGTPDFAIPVLSALLGTSYQVVGVYTRPDVISGRGRKIVPPPVKGYAVDHGLRIFQPPSLRPQEAQDELGALCLDVVIVAAYGLFLPRRLREMPKHSCLNVHPSLLPKYRGPAPVSSSILAGDAVTGVTIMEMDDGMDTGPTVAAHEMAIGQYETTDDLTLRLFQLGAELLVELLPAWIRGELDAKPQDESQAMVTKLLSKEDGEIDWSLDANQLGRQIRAYQPWPGSFTYLNGEMLKIVAAEVGPADADGAPAGQVLRLPDGAISVATGAGVLTLNRLQLAGRRIVSVREFAQGYPEFVTSQLG